MVLLGEHVGGPARRNPSKARWPGPDHDRSRMPRSSSRLQSAAVFVFEAARIRHGILPVGVGQDWSGGVGREACHRRRQVIAPLEGLVVCDCATHVCCHPPHRRDEARLGTADNLVVGLVVYDRGYKILPFAAVGIRLRLGRRPEQVVVCHPLAFIDGRSGR